MGMNKKPKIYGFSPLAEFGKTGRKFGFQKDQEEKIRIKRQEPESSPDWRV